MITAAQSVAEELYHALLEHGVHPALTGGVLYKPGVRKDIDFVLYTAKPLAVGEQFPYLRVFNVLTRLGFLRIRDFGRVIKARRHDVDFDFIIPQSPEGTYYADTSDGSGNTEPHIQQAESLSILH